MKGFLVTSIMLLCVLTSGSSAHLSAQESPNLEQGLKPFGSFHSGDIDNISFSSGAVSIDLPIWNYPQRGRLQADVALRYESKMWENTGFCGASGCNIHWQPSSLGVQVSYLPTTGATCTMEALNGSSWPDGYVPTECTAITKDGSSHIMGKLDTTGHYFYSLDGSGVGYTITRAYYDPVDNIIVTEGVADTNGDIAYGNQFTIPYHSDVNGNFWTRSVDQASPVTDTKGVVVATPVGNSDFSGCTGTLPITSATVLPVQLPGGVAGTIRFCYATVTINPSFPIVNGVNIYQGSGAFALLQSVVLPEGQTWTFAYDNYGEVTAITFPTGGSVSYTYDTFSFCPVEALASNIMTGTTPESRYVTSRSVDANDGSGSHTWTYTWSTSPTASQPNQFTVVVKDPELNEAVHTETGIAGTCSFYETQLKSYQGLASANVLLKTVDTQYQGNPNPMLQFSVNGASSTAVGVFPIGETTTLADGMASRVEHDYDSKLNYFEAFALGGTPSGWQSYSGSFGNEVATRNYDYGVTGPVGQSTPAPLKQTLTQYQGDIDPSYYAWPIRSHLVHSVTVADGLGVQQSLVTYGYDEQPLVTSGITTQHSSQLYDGLGAPLPGKRGNQTSELHWNNTGAALATTHTYYDTGSLASTTDPLRHTTAYFYDGSYAGAYRTSTVLPSVNGIQQTHSAMYDFNTGTITSYTDPNGQSSRFTYDGLGRIWNVALADNPSGLSHTFCYPNQTSVIEFTAQSSPLSLTQDSHTCPSAATSTTHTFDGVGRVVRVATAESSSQSVLVDTTYNARGLVHTVSTPYRSTSDVSYGLTSYLYDALSRKTAEGHTDGTSIITSYQENVATTTDEGGSSWRRTSDALGRLTQVLEPGLLETDYGYDPLSDLISVAQHGAAGETPRSRSFGYDSLSRLLWSNSPETGTTCYGFWRLGTLSRGMSCVGGYDANGNLLYKTDARGLTNSYTYDALNRLIFKTNGADTQAYGYDTNNGIAQPTGQSNNPIGRLTYASHYGHADELFYFDSVGRINAELYCLPSDCGNRKLVTAQYDLAGHMTDITYPDGRHIQQNWNSAGQLGSPSGGGPAVADANSGTQYVEAITYNPDSTPNVMTLGNGVVQTISENNRLQVQSMTASTPLQPFSGQPFISQTYNYVNPAAPQSGNNGNIWGIVDGLNGTRSQSFAYDALNRISSFSLGTAPNAVLNQRYGIDSFGNMSLLSSSGTPLYTFDPLTNRINNLPCASSLLPYDPAGNQTCDTDQNGALRSYVYDAESRISSITVQGGGTPFQTYTYDANGARVSKTGADGSVTEYVHFNGQPIAERDQTGTWTDYVYAAGRKIAMIPGQDHVFRISGDTTGSWGFGRWDLALPQNLTGGNYTVLLGDKLCWRQLGQNIPGGPVVWFSNGSDAILEQWTTSDGQSMFEMPARAGWENRCVDLTGNGADTGASIVHLALLGYDFYGQYPSWSVSFADMAIISASGAVTQILASSAVSTTMSWGGYESNLSGVSITPATSVIDGSAQAASHYFVADHLGTAQIELSQGGWPVWQGQFAPFGGELVNNQPLPAGVPDGSSNRYKFTGKERDAESGLDYFGARYYASNMGRFMSPDWADKPEAVPYSDLSNPQSLNLYGYVNNNPLSKADPDGHCPFCAVVVEKLEEGAVGGLIGAGVNVGITALTNPNATRSDYIGAAESGFITGSVAGLTGGGSLAVQVGVNAVANVVGGVVERSTAAGHLDVGSAKDVATDAVIGAAGPVLAKGFGKAAQAINGKDAEALGKAAEGKHLGDRHSASLKRQAAAASAFDEFGRKAGDRTGQVIDGANRANDNLNKDKKDHQ